MPTRSFAERMLLPPFFLGLDGGGSHTRALLIDAQGETVGSSRLGGCNPNNIGLPQAVATVRSAIEMAVESCGCQEIAQMCLGIAGVGTTDDQRQFQQSLLDSLSCQGGNLQIRVTHDLELAHYAAFSGGPGICIIAGTGSSVFGLDPSGTSYRNSGRSAGFDDPGSGYSIAKQAIYLGIIGSLEPNAPREAIAALAPNVIDAVAKGNTAARSLIASEAEKLVELTAPVIRQCQSADETPAIALLGGMIQAPGPFQEALKRELLTLFPKALFIGPTLTPVEAATQIAVRDWRRGTLA